MSDAQAPAVQILPLPKSPADFSPGWFTAVLRGTGLDVEVARCTVHPVGVGAGMMSSIARVELSYGRGRGPDSVVVKLPTENVQNREVALAFDNYAREVMFYQKAAHLTPMRTPTLYLAAIDGSADFALVLEDLSQWRLGNQVVGCTLEQAQHCMRALAALHGAFWNRVDGGDCDWIPNSYPSVMSEGLQQGTAASYDRFVELFSEQIPEPLKGLKNPFVAALPGLQKWINDGPRTVIHGDFRMDNLFFGNGPEQAPVACCDWQASLRGKGVHDVAYLLSGSVPTPVRRDHEQALLRLWLDGLADQGVVDYPFEQAFADYRRAVLYLWTYVVVIAGSMDSGSVRSQQWITAMVQRAGAAIQDLHCIELLREM